MAAHHTPNHDRMTAVAQAALEHARRHRDWLPGDRLVVLMTSRPLLAPLELSSAPPDRATAWHGYPSADWPDGRARLADLLLHAVDLGRAAGLTPANLAELLRVIPA